MGKRPAGAIRWYSTNADLAAEDRGEIALPAALDTVDRYFQTLRPNYASGEEALAATMFSFGRADDDFIEICLHAADRTSLRIELPRPGFMRSGYQAEMELASKDEVRRYVDAYFTMDCEQFRAHVEQALAREKR